MTYMTNIVGLKLSNVNTKSEKIQWLPFWPHVACLPPRDRSTGTGGGTNRQMGESERSKDGLKVLRWLKSTMIDDDITSFVVLV